MSLFKKKHIKDFFQNTFSLKKARGLTLVELIVVITILAIIGTIAFISFLGYAKNSRDSVRLSDINKIKTSMGIFIVDSGKYPEPSNAVNVTYSGTTVWKQGTFGDSTFTNIRVLNKKPVDPITINEYSYSVSENKLEYQIGGILEGNDFYTLDFVENSYAADAKREAIAYLEGTYNGLIGRARISGIDYLLALPSIISNDLTTPDVEHIVNENKLIYPKYANLPASYANSKYNVAGGYNYNPNALLVYEGKLSGLLEINNQTILLNNIQQAYSGTLLEDDDLIISSLSKLDIDLVKPSVDVTNFACNLIIYTLKYFVDCEGHDFIVFYATNILHLDVSNLPGSQINIIFQDKNNGDFWFGTNDGVAKYSNGSWTVYQKDPQDSNSLVHNNVTSIAIDNTGNYWFGTVNGISMYDGDSTWTTYNNNVLVSTHIQYIYTSSDGTVWIGTNGGVTTYNSEVWTDYLKKKSGLSHNNITAIFEDSESNIRFGTNSQGVDKYTAGVITNFSTPDLPSKVVTQIFEDSTGKMWFGSIKGVASLTSDETTWTTFDVSNTAGLLAGDEITFIYEDTNNNLWFGTTSGVSKYDTTLTSWSKYDTSSSPLPLSGNEIKNITEDTDGNIVIFSDEGTNTIDSNGDIID